jgi:hypothetical protein
VDAGVPPPFSGISSGRKPLEPCGQAQRLRILRSAAAAFHGARALLRRSLAAAVLARVGVELRPEIAHALAGGWSTGGFQRRTPTGGAA